VLSDKREKMGQASKTITFSTLASGGQGAFFEKTAREASGP
jgi:hypothetical protein